MRCTFTSVSFGMTRPLALRAVHVLPSAYTAPVGTVLSMVSVTRAVWPSTRSAFGGRLVPVEHLLHQRTGRRQRRNAHHEEQDDLHPQGRPQHRRQQTGHGAQHEPDGDQSHRHRFHDAKDHDGCDPNDDHSSSFRVSPWFLA